FKTYGNVFRITLLGTPAYVVANPVDARGPYRDEGGHPDVPFGSFKLLMGDYPVTSTKDVHGPWRKVFVAALGPQGLQSMFPKVKAVMEQHLQLWERDGKMQLFRAARTMGLDLAADVVADVQLSKDVQTWLDGLFGLPLQLPGSALSRALAAKERLLSLLMREVKQDHEAFKQQWDAAHGDLAKAAAAMNESADGLGLRYATRLGLFGLGATELRHSAISLLHGMMAAADTTRFALFNTWALLAMSPRVQEELHQEQRKVVAEHGPELSYKAACSMPYMDATIKECLRLLPASAGGLRLLTADLHVGETIIPSGSHVWLYSSLAHCLDPALWDGDTACEVPPHMDFRNNLEQAFRPERWLSEATKPKFYYSFGSGSHLCPGANLVYLEVKTMLALVLRKYRLRLATPDMLRRCSFFPFTVPPAGTDTVLLEPREAAAA
ncbi:hypothetical protein TSOC_002086, partial [Tetrabaena socialis]